MSESGLGDSRGRLTPVLTALAVSLVVSAAGCAEDPSGARGKRPQGSPVVVDIAAGSVGGVRLGDSRAAVRRRLGPAKCGGSLQPLGDEDVFDYGGPPSLTFIVLNDRNPRPTCSMRYRGLAVGFRPRYGAYAVLTTDPSARTTRGVGIGDDVEAVKREYPTARCSEEDDGVPPYCVVGRRRTSEADPGSPRELHFGLGEDRRVASIWLSATSPRGLPKPARRRGG